jgi:hypothetical protein
MMHVQWIYKPHFTLVEIHSGYGKTDIVQLYVLTNSRYKTTRSYSSGTGAFTSYPSFPGRSVFAAYNDYSTCDMFVEIRSHKLKHTLCEALKTAGIHIQDP